MPDNPDMLVYVGRKRCGCVKALACNPVAPYAARECWAMENDGLRVEVMRWGDAYALGQCGHRAPLDYEPPRLAVPLDARTAFVRWVTTP